MAVATKQISREQLRKEILKHSLKGKNVERIIRDYIWDDLTASQRDQVGRMLLEVEVLTVFRLEGLELGRGRGTTSLPPAITSTPALLTELSKNNRGPIGGSSYGVKAVKAVNKRLAAMIRLENGESKPLAECTPKECLYAAQVRRVQAKGNLEWADYYEKVGNIATSWGSPTIGALPPEGLAQFDRLKAPNTQDVNE